MIKIDVPVPELVLNAKQGVAPALDAFELELAAAKRKTIKHDDDDDDTPIRLLAAGLKTLAEKKKKKKKADAKEGASKGSAPRGKGVKEKTKSKKPPSQKPIEKKTDNHPTQEFKEKKTKKPNSPVARNSKMPSAQFVAKALGVNLEQLRLEHLKHPDTQTLPSNTAPVTLDKANTEEPTAHQTEALGVLELIDILENAEPTQT